MENNNVKVSVIIPVYNVEEFLYDCINSVINQTLNDIEIICIDDCSTDSSFEILKYFETKDNRIKVIQNSENIGLGASRNVGIELASGDYIQFLDSDDWLDFDCIEKLYNKLIKNDADLIMFKLLNYDQDTNTFYKTDYYSIDYMKEYYEKVFNYENLENDVIFRLPNSACNKMYKTSLIKNNNFRFPEGLIHEDNPFYFYMFFSAKKILITDDYFYNRRIRSGSITTSFDSKLIDVLKITDIVLNFFIKNKLYQKYKKNILNYLVGTIKSKFYLIPQKYKNLFFRKLKNNLNKYIYVYNILDDFKRELYSSNEKFFNLVLYSKNFYEFERNISKKKFITNDYKISIIIPIYNAKRSDIIRAFRSLQQQTIKFNNLEIIFIDDCSNFIEGTSYIQELNDLYDNVKSIYLKKNRGSGYARNIGIESSQSNYIMFLDHDDFFLKDACKILYETITNEDVDMVGGNYINMSREGKKVNWSIKNLSYFNKIENVKENMNFFKVDPSIWTKIYKRDFLVSNNILFKDYKSGQDLLFNQETLFKAKGIVFIDEPILQYEIRKNISPELSSMSLNNSKMILKTLLKVYEDSYNLFKKYNEKYTFLPLNVLNYFTNSRLLNSNLNIAEFSYIFESSTYLFEQYLKNDQVNKNKNLERFFEFIAKNDLTNAHKKYIEMIINQ